MNRQLLAALSICVAMQVTACSGLSPAPKPTTAPASAATAPAASGPRQMVLVVTADWDANSGRLQRFNLGDAGWKAVGEATTITVGRNGLAWGEGLHESQPGLPKREGDGRAPAGVFRIGPAFGYATSDSTALDYLPMTATHYCMDVSGSPLYNRIVDSRQVGEAAVAGSTEPMRLDLRRPGDQRYRLGFVIEHNANGRAQGGSCIFAHLWKAPGESTSGCTAMADTAMRELLDWLDPRLEPVFVQLPRDQYQRLRGAWKLPEIHDQ